MTEVWQFFISHWLAIFWAMILVPLAIVGTVKLVDEIQFRVERRRYRRSIRP